MSTGQDDPPDTSLVAKARAGDERAFGVLFDRYHAMIHTFAYRVCLTSSDADDLAQETFIRAARGIADYRGSASFKNWLFRIAHHAIVDWQRGQIRARNLDTAFAADAEIQSTARVTGHDAVHAALARLPAEWREAVVLVYLEEMNHRDAACILGCAETTVSWRIFRAKRELRKWLAPLAGDAS